MRLCIIFSLIYHFFKLNLDFIYLKSKERFDLRVQPLFKMEPGLRRNFFIALSFTLYDRQMAVTDISNYVEKSSSKVVKKAPEREREKLLTHCLMSRYFVYALKKINCIHCSFIFIE